MGIRATLSLLSELLRRADEPLWEHLVEKNKVRWRWSSPVQLAAQALPWTSADPVDLQRL